jgi:hypothetical protein
MRVRAWLPAELELPQAVQHNANGERVILSVENNMGTTCQVVFENDEHGDMVVRLRGWGNRPAAVGNMENTSFTATIPLQPTTSCEVCYRHLEPGFIAHPKTGSQSVRTALRGQLKAISPGGHHAMDDPTLDAVLD